jgi:hypothetical protein
MACSKDILFPSHYPSSDFLPRDQPCGLHSGAADKPADKMPKTTGNTSNEEPSADKTADKNDPDDAI